MELTLKLLLKYPENTLRGSFQATPKKYKNVRSNGSTKTEKCFHVFSAITTSLLGK